MNKIVSVILCIMLLLSQFSISVDVREVDSEFISIEFNEVSEKFSLSNIIMQQRANNEKRCNYDLQIEEMDYDQSAEVSLNLLIDYNGVEFSVLTQGVLEKHDFSNGISALMGETKGEIQLEDKDFWVMIYVTKEFSEERTFMSVTLQEMTENNDFELVIFTLGSPFVTFEMQDEIGVENEQAENQRAMSSSSNGIIADHDAGVVIAGNYGMMKYHYASNANRAALAVFSDTTAVEDYYYGYLMGAATFVKEATIGLKRVNNTTSHIAGIDSSYSSSPNNDPVTYNSFISFLLALLGDLNYPTGLASLLLTIPVPTQSTTVLGCHANVFIDYGNYSEVIYDSSPMVIQFNVSTPTPTSDSYNGYMNIKYTTKYSISGMPAYTYMSYPLDISRNLSIK